MAAAVTFWLRVPDWEGNMSDAVSNSKTGNLHAAEAGRRDNPNTPTRRGSGAHPQALSARTFLWLIGVGTCLLWLLAPASASAQSIGGPRTPSFAENGTGAVATYTATGFGGTVSWSLTGTDSSHFTITNGVLRFNNAPDYEDPDDANTDNDYSFNIYAARGSTTVGAAITVSVTDIVPYVSTPTTVDFQENGTGVVATFEAIEFEGDVTWAISVLSIDTDFTISGRGSQNRYGDLTFNAAPDYENPHDTDNNNVYSVAVIARRGSSFDSEGVYVTVTDEDEPPVVSGSTTINYSENSTAAVATYAATDPEGGTTFTWSLSGDDSNDFTISTAGVLSFSSTPDYENAADANTNNEYRVTVEASDAGGLIGTLPVTVTVTNQNEPPVVSGNTTILYADQSTVAVATYTASDPEGVSTFTWSLSGDDSDDFTISTAGVLSFSSTPDYENPTDANTNNEYRVTVQASDGSETGTLDVIVIINRPPVWSGETALTFEENGTDRIKNSMDQDAFFWISDPEGDVSELRMTGADSDKISISGGNLTFDTSPDYDDPADADTDNVYEITLEARNTGVVGAPWVALSITVTVTDVAEPPVVSGRTDIL